MTLLLAGVSEHGLVIMSDGLCRSLNPTAEASVLTEDFQNQFIGHLKAIDEIVYKLKLADDILMDKNADAGIDDEFLSKMKALDEDMEKFQQNYNLLKEDFKLKIKL